MKALSLITNRHVVSALCAAPILFSCAYASAEDVAPAAAEPAPAYTLTYNLGLYSSYMFRGVDLSDGPAVQGGIDWAHSSGFYLGTWWSNIDPYVNGGSPTTGAKGNHVESDWYGGYAHTFENGIGVNVLGNYYAYLESHKIGDRNENSFEASVALSYKWLTYTYYRVLTDYYGVANTKGSDYHELKVNYKLPIGDLNFMTKVGYQNTRNQTGSEGDFAIGLNRDFSLPGAGKPIEGFNAGAYYTTTFDVENEEFYKSADGRDTNEDKLWFYVKRTW
ncbi:TorF family putative porin [Methylotenera versatilis]|uniref:Uncharacterized protein n=1 Tax=Methylotenera versatilis (strain 301) TaxID=666681 RepID=D7DIN0_METV0|nr:TorF family putative porin [Methylotenera versatilis]ADI29915.1 conserved hypothetical protein [Methylotenera versatilis 301]